ncbi:MAG: hypothetical protein ACM3PF_13565 [Bacteroidota bacterium]
MRTRAAWIIAIVADALQIALFPIFGEGFASPATDALDVVVAIAMTALLGWHFAFLPSLIAEVVPGLNLFPTWTAAVFFVTRRRRRAEAPAAVPRKEIPPPTR